MNLKLHVFSFSELAWCKLRCVRLPKSLPFHVTFRNKFIWSCLVADFQSIFLGMPKSHITVITITQKTLNDMSGWSSSVEEEREKLLDEVCFAIFDLLLFNGS